ncbi:hypothetical protein CK203_061617 [Vitis vinifera]|uniref:Uncharacterized protein n=1 Tax=Vitis vinifera TaxID=29760 RepID=A0A438FRM2_VITVI|nr:hypothetical protein CK203_061617 [Vitis vinifera]
MLDTLSASHNTASELCCRNIFSDDGLSKPNDAAAGAVQALGAIPSMPVFLSLISWSLNVDYCNLQVMDLLTCFTIGTLAMARYARRECSCLSLTDKESIFSGNFTFSSLENPKSDSVRG